MAEYKPWKALERRHAHRMGGVRLWRPDFSDSDPDGESDAETWDCKVRASHAVVSTFEDCWRKYKAHANGRRFHLCLYSRKHPRAGDFVVQRADVYAELSAKADGYDKIMAALDERNPDVQFVVPPDA